MREWEESARVMVYALLGAVLIGVSLGLLGAGGSILTVPILHYLLHHAKSVAVDEAYAIVGSISLAAGLRTARKGLVDWEWVLVFGVTGLVGTFAGERVVAHISPQLRYVLLALTMGLAAFFMIRPPAARAGGGREGGAGRANPVFIGLLGVGVGCLTKVVGIGGGFVIVPSLALLGGLEMRRAIGTSLPIIALNSTSSLVLSLATHRGRAAELDWLIVAVFAAIGIAGSLAGTALSGRLRQVTLRRLFAGFLIVLGGYMLWRELPGLM